MGKRILFSPVGGTDPIKYLYDGSMLHICRHYLPDVVYLYLSQEMLATHRKDNRYIKCIEKLGEMTGHTFEIVTIEREELSEVHQYDYFYREFREELTKIRNAMSGDDVLYLNISSGTPAMKSALLILATMGEYKFIPVQVSSPQKAMNAEQDDWREFSIEEQWDANEDNKNSSENRCEEVICMNLTKILKINIIKKHIMAYDYSAALQVADEIKEDIDPKAYDLIKIGAERLKMNLREIQDTTYKVFPVKEEKQKWVFEYALKLKVKLEQENYSDFIVGITPLMQNLFEMVLNTQFGVDIEKSVRDDNGRRRWNLAKLEANGLLDILDKAYEEEGKIFDVNALVSNDAEFKLIEQLCKQNNNKEIVECSQYLRSAEEFFRNPVAHQIITVTEKGLKGRKPKGKKDEVVYYTPGKVFERIKELFGYTGICLNKKDWDSYKQLNDRIVQLIDIP